MDWLVYPLGVIGLLVVLFAVFVFGRKFGIKYAFEHGEEVFGADEPLKAEYVIGGRPFYQKPLVIRQLRELAELEEQYKDKGNMHIDPLFYSIALIEGRPGGENHIGSTTEKTAFFDGDHLNTVIMQQVQHYFFECNQLGERRDMLKDFKSGQEKRTAPIQ